MSLLRLVPRSFRTVPQLEVAKLSVAKLSTVLNHSDDQGRLRGRKTVLLLGPTGMLGSEVALRALQMGMNVVAFTRREGALFFEQHPNAKVIRANQSDMTDYALVQRRVAEACREQDVLFFNGLGRPYAPPGQSLREINNSQFDVMMDVLESLDGGTMRSCRVVDPNSLAVPVALATGGIPTHDEYIRSKQLIKLRLAASPLEHLSLNVSYVYRGPINRFLDLQHAWGPDQMANSRYQILVGSGQQPLQPVHIRDIIDAIFGWKGGRQDVHAVGPDLMTIEQFYQAHCDMMGTRFNPLKLTYEQARILTDLHPNGHAAPYAVECAQRLDEYPIVFDSKPMEELVGRPLTTFEETFKEFKAGEIVSAKPPIYDQIVGTLKGAVSSPQKMKSFLRFCLLHAPELSIRILYSL